LTRSFADRLAAIVGTGLYSGHFPVFPGTVGSVAGLVLYLILVRAGALREGSATGWAITLVVVYAAGVAAAHRCEKLYGHDAKPIVIDEIWGMLISLVYLPVTWKWMLAAFLLFRFFDVIKPFPARRAERVGGGLGIMLDDAVAGLYALIVLQLVRTFLG
jgi:phosphatidylglycerophosphatase A